MTRRERVIETINHKAPSDFIPYQIGFTHQSWEKMAAYYKDENFDEKIGNHIKDAYYSGEFTEVKEGYFKDDFGVVWNRTGADKDIGVIDNIMIPEPDVSIYTFPAVPEADLRARCQSVVAGADDCFTTASLGFSLFERAWTLTGMEDLLVYMVSEPGFVDALMDKILEFNLKILDIYLEYDVDCVHFGDDWGQQKGLIMGPVMWRRFIKPRLAEMYGAVKKTGRFVSQHSCGDIRDVMPDVIDIGLDVYQTFQPEIYDIRAIKDAYGDRLTFWGGISTQRLLPFETPEKIIEKAAEIIRIVGKNGGYIVAPTHAIPGDVPEENIDALIRLCTDQARYIPAY